MRLQSFPSPIRDARGIYFWRTKRRDDQITNNTHVHEVCALALCSTQVTFGAAKMHSKCAHKHKHIIANALLKRIYIFILQLCDESGRLSIQTVFFCRSGASKWALAHQTIHNIIQSILKQI